MSQKKSFLITLAIGMLIFACISILGWSHHSQAASKISWEYKYLSPGDNMQAEKQLNELGAQGWELIEILPNMQQGTVYPGGTFYLKRSKQ